MITPSFPNKEDEKQIKNSVVDLLESIAQEELAISHLVNAQAIKIQAFIGEDLNFPTLPTKKEMVDFNRSIYQLLDTLLMKEWILLKKLEATLYLGSYHDTPVDQDELFWDSWDMEE